MAVDSKTNIVLGNVIQRTWGVSSLAKNPTHYLNFRINQDGSVLAVATMIVRHSSPTSEAKAYREEALETIKAGIDRVLNEYKEEVKKGPHVEPVKSSISLKILPKTEREVFEFPRNEPYGTIKTAFYCYRVCLDVS